MNLPEGSGRLLGTDAGVSIQFERSLGHPSAKVWRAITESDELARWFPAELQGDRKEGEPIRIVSPQDRFAPVDGRFTVFEPGQILEYTWGDEVLRWELRSTDSGCGLLFTNVLDSQAVAIGVTDIASAWHACLDVLEFVLADESPPYTTDERFTQVCQAYRDSWRGF